MTMTDSMENIPKSDDPLISIEENNRSLPGAKNTLISHIYTGLRNKNNYEEYNIGDDLNLEKEINACKEDLIKDTFYSYEINKIKPILSKNFLLKLKSQ